MPVTIEQEEDFVGFCDRHERHFEGDGCLFATENPMELTAQCPTLEHDSEKERTLSDQQLDRAIPPHLLCRKLVA